MQGFFAKEISHGPCESQAAESINVVLLSEFMRLMSIPSFDLIKMDIESAEKQVFSGDPGIQAIMEKTKVFVAETHERFTPGSSAPMFEMFEKLGFLHYLDDENDIFLHPDLMSVDCKLRLKSSIKDRS